MFLLKKMFPFKVIITNLFIQILTINIINCDSNDESIANVLHMNMNNHKEDNSIGNNKDNDYSVINSHNGNGNGNGNYNFEYEIDGPQGTRSWRREQRISEPQIIVIGSYGVKDVNGELRIVEYKADKNGFRANVKHQRDHSLQTQMIPPNHHSKQSHNQLTHSKDQLPLSQGQMPSSQQDQLPPSQMIQDQMAQRKYHLTTSNHYAPEHQEQIDRSDDEIHAIHDKSDHSIHRSYDSIDRSDISSDNLDASDTHELNIQGNQEEIGYENDHKHHYNGNDYVGSDGQGILQFDVYGNGYDLTHEQGYQHGYEQGYLVEDGYDYVKDGFGNDYSKYDYTRDSKDSQYDDIFDEDNYISS